MAELRLYVDAPLAAGAAAPGLSREQTHYVLNVMRRRAGDTLLLFNGRDGEWLANVAAAAKREVRLDLVLQTRPQQGEPGPLLWFAPLKRARQELLLEKATELGALTVMAGAEITGLDVVDGHMRGVRTTEGDITAETVVIACGIWSPAIAAMAGALVSVGPMRWAMGAIGAVVLVLMGVRTLSAAQRVRSGLEVPSEVVTPGRALRTSLAATASNPLTVASWATAFAAASTASVIGGWADATALLCGIGAGSLGWFAVLTGGVALAGRRLGDRSLQAADTVAGLGLVGFGALLGLRTVRER